MYMEKSDNILFCSTRGTESLMSEAFQCIFLWLTRILRNICWLLHFLTLVGLSSLSIPPVDLCYNSPTVGSQTFLSNRKLPHAPASVGKITVCTTENLVEVTRCIIVRISFPLVFFSLAIRLCWNLIHTNCARLLFGLTWFSITICFISLVTGCGSSWSFWLSSTVVVFKHQTDASK